MSSWEVIGPICTGCRFLSTCEYFLLGMLEVVLAAVDADEPDTSDGVRGFVAVSSRARRDGKVRVVDLGSVAPSNPSDDATDVSGAGVRINPCLSPGFDIASFWVSRLLGVRAGPDPSLCNLFLVSLEVDGGGTWDCDEIEVTALV